MVQNCEMKFIRYAMHFSYFYEKLVLYVFMLKTIGKFWISRDQNSERKVCEFSCKICVICDRVIWLHKLAIPLGMKIR
jgi:hypothetical protein